VSHPPSGAILLYRNGVDECQVDKYRQPDPYRVGDVIEGVIYIGHYPETVRQFKGLHDDQRQAGNHYPRQFPNRNHRDDEVHCKLGAQIPNVGKGKIAKELREPPLKQQAHHAS
jgi:hypothetical protein